MASDRLPAGTVIGKRFEIGPMLGFGGLGEVYDAVDRKTDKHVAIRIFANDLVNDEAIVERLRHQVKQASGLAHKNIARVLGMGKEDALRYLAMELVEGQNLRQLLERKRQAGRTFSLKGAYNVLAHVCNALHEAHKSMIHGMPGPGAILINKAGRIKLVDFGIVRALPSGAVGRLGDFYTIGPEMHAEPSAAGPRTDIYSLGVVLHELLTGQPPTETREPMGNLVAGLPPAVEQVVWRCLDRDPRKRFGDAQQVKAAFYQAIEGHGPGSDEGIAETDARQVYPPAAAKQPAAPVVAAPQPPAHTAPKPAPASRPLAAAGPGPQVPSPPAPQPLSPIASSPHQLTQPPPQEVNIEDLLVDADADVNERWLIQKDRLDFGPFTSGALKRALYKTEFSGEDILVDQETGQRSTIRQNPHFQEFMRHLDRHLAKTQAKQVELKQRVQDRKRRTVLVTMLVIGIVILAAGGVVAAWLLTKDPEVREKVVYREKTKLLAGIKGLEVQWKAEPADQARRRRRHKKRKRKGGTGEDVTRLGDATKAGGDELLSQKVVQNVMRSNFSKLTACVQQAWRSDRSLRQVNIDFGILGSGVVSTLKVNGKTSGPFHSCVRRRMRAIRFPKFDGTLTKASFSMRLSI